MNKPNQQFDPTCDPVEVQDPKTGVKRVMYLCAQPFKKRAKHYRENSLHFWTDLGLIATIVILVGTLVTLWVYNSLRHVNLVDFSVMYTSEELINGEHVDFTVAYTNTSKKPVTGAEVIVRFPDGLQDVTIADERFNTTTQTISLGTLEPGMGGEFAVSGLLLSDIGVTEKFVFVLNYFNDLGQPQQEFTAREFVVERSVVDVALEAPQRVIIASDFPSHVTVTNNADHELPSLKVQLQYHPSFETEGGSLVTLPALISGESITKDIEGVITQAAPGNHPLTVVVLTEFQGKDFVLNKATRTTELAFSKLITRFINTDANKAIKPGEQTTATLRIENNEQFTATNISVDFTVSGDFADKNFLDRTYDTVDNATVTLGDIPDLGPDASHELTFSAAALRRIFITQTSADEQNLTIGARIKFSPNNTDNAIYVNAAPLVVPVNSSLEVQSFGLFYTNTGDQIGVGSLPPRVGDYTAYWGIIRLTNGVNALRNVTVRATVPAYIDYTDIYNVTLGAPVRYLPATSQIEWYIQELPAYAGVIGAAPEARIQLAVVPSESQVGQVLNLLTNISVSAVDSRTGETLTASGATITSNLFDDARLNQVAE